MFSVRRGWSPLEYLSQSQIHLTFAMTQRGAYLHCMYGCANMQWTSRIFSLVLERSRRGWIPVPNQKQPKASGVQYSSSGSECNHENKPYHSIRSARKDGRITRGHTRHVCLSPMTTYNKGCSCPTSTKIETLIGYLNMNLQPNFPCLPFLPKKTKVENTSTFNYVLAVQIKVGSDQAGAWQIRKGDNLNIRRCHL